jgi:hypothetical protein
MLLFDDIKYLLDIDVKKRLQNCINVSMYVYVYVSIFLKKGKDRYRLQRLIESH